MTQLILRSKSIYALQNGLAALIFSLLLSGEVLAHLLDRFPGMEILWRLTSLSNRTMAPLLNALSSTLSKPLLLMGLLAIAAALPLIAWRRRSLLGTAISGHVALGALVVICWWALKRANTGQAMASLSDVFDPRVLDSNVLSFVCLTGVMAVLCVSNHLAFFGHRARPSHR